MVHDDDKRDDHEEGTISDDALSEIDDMDEDELEGMENDDEENA